MNVQTRFADKDVTQHDNVDQAYGKKILLIDDIDFFSEIEQTALEVLAEFQVFTAYSGAEALMVVEAERPDLVFLELYMDNMDGDECCRRIKEIYGPGVPVIIVTHGDSADDFERCWASGCDEIIVKPINHHLFLATAKKYLNMESRCAARLAARLKVKYGTAEQHILADYSINLSTGGLFLATAEVLPSDTQFAIEFLLPGRAVPICCHARVAWINDPLKPCKDTHPPGMGLQFIDITLSDVDAIREYLSGDRLVPSW